MVLGKSKQQFRNDAAIWRMIANPVSYTHLDVYKRQTQYNGVRMTLHYDVYDKATGTLRCTGNSRHCFINAEGKPAILKRCWPEFDAALAANTVKE